METADYAKIVARNIRRIAYEHHRTQADISRDLKIPQATVSTWMNGQRMPRMDKIEILCNYFQVSRADIMEEEPEEKEDAVWIPVYGEVAAGVPLEMIEDIRDKEQITADMLRGGKQYFALTIRGDSMQPRMMDGDVVIVLRQDDAESGDVVIATVNGDSATCKRLRKYRDGIELISFNPAYEPKFFTNKEVIKIPVRILGKVVELRGKF